MLIALTGRPYHPIRFGVHASNPHPTRPADDEDMARQCSELAEHAQSGLGQRERHRAITDPITIAAKTKPVQSGNCISLDIGFQEKGAAAVGRLRPVWPEQGANSLYIQTLVNAAR